MRVAAGLTRHRATSTTPWRISTSRCGSIRRIRPYNNRGITWYRRGDLDRAIADYDQAIRLDPKYEYAYANRGAAWATKGGLDRAMADFDPAVRLDPKDAEAYYNRGLAWKAKDDLDRAIADFDQAVRLGPKFGAHPRQPRQRLGRQGRPRPGDRGLQPGDPARSERCPSLLQPRHGVGDEAQSAKGIGRLKMHSQLAPSDPDGLKAVERVLKELSAR